MKHPVRQSEGKTTTHAKDKHLETQIPKTFLPWIASPKAARSLMDRLRHSRGAAEDEAEKELAKNRAEGGGEKTN